MRIFLRFGKALVFIEVGIARTLRQHLRHSQQGLWVVGVIVQYFPRHVHHLVGVVSLLVAVHRRLVKNRAEFAIGELGGEIVRGLFLCRRVRESRRGFVSIEFRLRLGLGRALARRRGRGLPGRLRRLLVLRRGRVALGEAAGRNTHDYYSRYRCSFHAFSLESQTLATTISNSRL